MQFFSDFLLVPLIRHSNCVALQLGHWVKGIVFACFMILVLTPELISIENEKVGKQQYEHFSSLMILY